MRAGYLGSLGDAAVDDLAISHDMHDGNAVMRMLSPKASKFLCVPLAIAERAVDPHVLATPERHLQSHLRQQARLPACVVAGVEWRALEIALPLWQSRLEDLRVRVRVRGESESEGER